jgi:hypothetical protein
MLESIITRTEKETTLFLMDQKLLKSQINCLHCLKEMQLKFYNGNKEGLVWRCCNIKCEKFRNRRSVRDCSFFYDLKISFKKLQIFYFWSNGMTQELILKNVNIKRNCLIKI